MSEVKTSHEDEQGKAPENQSSHINPSAPNDASITPGSDYKQPAHPPKTERAQSGN